MTEEELSELPAVVDVRTAARVLGLSRTAAYELIRVGEWPTPVYRLGRLIRIPTGPMLALLCIERSGQVVGRPAVGAAAHQSDNRARSR